MSDYLCLRFREPEINPQAVLSWVSLSATAEVLSSGQCLLRDIVGTIPQSDHSLRVIVLVPGSSVLLTAATVAPKQRRHVRQVLPFIVEEQIIDPVESMHLATPVLLGDADIPVAAVRRNVIASWLDQLGEYALFPDYMFVDACCVPAKEGKWQLMLEDKNLLFKQGPHNALSLRYDMAKSVVQLALAKAQEHDSLQDDEGAAIPEEQDSDSDHGEPTTTSDELALITINSRDVDALSRLYENGSDSDENGVDAHSQIETEHTLDRSNSLDAIDQTPGATDPEIFVASAEIDTWQAQLDSFIRSENMLTRQIRYRETATELLAVNAVRTVDQQLNLLQGDFRPANANAESQRFIYRIGLGVAACLAFFLIVTLCGGFYLNYRADGFFDKSVAIYRDLFPKQRRVLDPVKQMKRQLKGQTVGGTTSEFLPLLDAASKSLVSLEEQYAGGASIKQLRYDIQRGNISIDIHASNIDDLEAYKDLLVGEGLDVDILSANQDGDTVKGRLQIGRS